MSAVLASNEAAPPQAAASPVPLSGRVSALLAFASGLLYFLAFPGVDLWPLAFVALVPLIVALRGQSPRRALFLGWLAGFTMTMFGFYWLLNMLETFSGFPLPLCVLFMAILCAYQAGRIGLLGWLYARAEQRGWPAALVFTVAFAASEQAFPLLFPWSYAATVHQLPALLQVAEIGGPILAALPLIAINLALAEIVLSRLERRPLRWRLAGLLAAAPVVSALYGAVRIPQVDAAVAAARPARIGLVQANMSLFGKRKDKLEGLRRHQKMTRDLLEEGKLDLVVWSETSVMSAFEESTAEKEIPSKISGKLGIPALFGAVLTRPVQDVRGKVFFNSAILTNNKGRVVGRYDKQFLLAFGEYLPLGEAFPILYQWSPHSGRFTHGKSMLPLSVGGHQIATFICYEDIIPGFVNEIVRAGSPDLLANLTNDAWFGDTTEPWIHLALSKMRAIEHRRFFVRSTNSGVSAFIDPVGRVIAHTETFQEQALRARLAWMRGTTAYEVLGDVPWWLSVLVAGALAFVVRPGTERRRRDRASASPLEERRPQTQPAPIAAAPEPALGPSGDIAAEARAFREQARRWLRRTE